MPLLGFQARFADLVASGAKRQTIRAYRKDRLDPKADDRLHLWTGLRQPGARKLGEATCTRATPIEIGTGGSIVLYLPAAAVSLTERHREGFALADGFESAAELVAWFRNVHGLPFRGLLIEWGKLEEGSKR